MLPPNSTFKVIVVDNFPDGNSNCSGFPRFSRSMQCQYPGWCLEILGNILQQTKIPFELSFAMKGPKGVNWGTLAENGTYIDGIQADVESGRVDTVCAFYQMTPNRYNHFDFTIPVTEIGFILHVLLLYYLRHYHKLKSRKSEDDAHHSYAQVINELVFSVFYAGFVLNTYPAFILSALLTKSDPFPFQSQSDVIRLISHGSYKLVVTSTSSWFVDNLKFSADPFFVELREALVKNPIVFASADEAVRLVQRGDHILQMVEDSSVVEKMAAICFVLLFSEGLPRKGAHFILPKNSQWIPFLNEQITLTNSFNAYTYRRYFEERNKYIPRQCEPSWFSLASGTSTNLDALNLQSLLGIFILGSFGLLIAAMSFLVEMMTKIALRRYRRRRRNLGRRE